MARENNTHSHARARFDFICATTFSSAKSVCETSARERDDNRSCPPRKRRYALRGAREQDTLSRPRARALRDSTRFARATFLFRVATIAAACPAHGGVRRMTRENNTHSQNRAHARPAFPLDLRTTFLFREIRLNDLRAEATQRSLFLAQRTQVCATWRARRTHTVTTACARAARFDSICAREFSLARKKLSAGST